MSQDANYERNRDRESYGIEGIDVTPLTGSRTNMQCSGDPTAVGCWVEAYLKDYHPHGYGTRVYSDVTVDGVRTVKVSRGSSCD